MSRKVGTFGEYGEGKADVRTRNMFEYIVASYFNELSPQLEAENKNNVPYLREMRNDWRSTTTNRPIVSSRYESQRTQDGGVRYDTDLKISNIKNLMLSLELNDYGRFGRANGLNDEAIVESFKTYKSNFEKLEAMGLHPHSTFDPELTSVVIPDMDVSKISTKFLTTRGKSLRELEANESFEILNHGGGRSIYSGQMPSAQEMQRRSNTATTTFGNAPVPNQAARRNQRGNQARNTPQTQAQANSIVNETFMGWDGDEQNNIRGLKHVLGAYLSSSDALRAKNMINDSQTYSGQHIQKSVELLRHLRSHGYDFSVMENDYDNQLNIRLDTGNRVEVRAVDTDENQQYIGRVYDTYNMYYHYVQNQRSAQAQFDHTAEGVISIVEFVEGNRTGDIKKTASNNSNRTQVRFSDIHKGNRHWLVAKPSDKYGVEDRYDALVFTDNESAELYMQESITSAQANVARRFNANDMLTLLDYENMIDEETEEFTDMMKNEFDKVLSSDKIIRRAQEEALREVHNVGVERSGERLEILERVRDSIIGDYDNGFNPSLTLEYMDSSGRSSERDSMLTALRQVDYDLDKIQGNEFGVNQIKERLVKFDETTGKTIDEIEHPTLQLALQTVHDTLKDSGFRATNEADDYDVKVDDNGVIRWEAERRLSGRTEKYETISGEIGQVMVPDEHGVIRTQFLGDNNYGFIPGHTGYYAFTDTDTTSLEDSRMERFRAKSFDKHLVEQVRGSLAHQITRPYNRDIGNIPQVLDASRLNSLYHGDVYGTRIELDYMETSPLSDEIKQANIQSRGAQRVRLDNNYSDHATTGAETRANQDKKRGLEDSASFSYWKAVGEKNVRVIHEDMYNYVDPTMTGSGRSQGLVVYLAEGATVNEDGSITPSDGYINKDGEIEADRSTVHKLSYFDLEKHNPWDRNQMATNDIMSALRVDDDVNVALAPFGGWTVEDACVVSKNFAERNKIKGVDPNPESRAILEDVVTKMKSGEHADYEAARTSLEGTQMMWSESKLQKGVDLLSALDDVTDEEEKAKLDKEYNEFLDAEGTFRPLRNGDKITDFGGNKGTISLILDPDLTDEEAKAKNLVLETAYARLNPHIDVIAASSSLISRQNGGITQRLMENPQDVVVPDSESLEADTVLPNRIGKMSMMVLDNPVDKMTHAYTREDVLAGKGRKVSGQLAWALQSKGAKGILNEVYGDNDNAWATYREYLITTGLDMRADGTLIKGYEPHYGEERQVFEYDKEMSNEEFLNNINTEGGFLKLPFKVVNRAGDEVDEIPVLSASLRESTELTDGSMRRNDFTNSYMSIYRHVGAYYDAIEDMQNIEKSTELDEADKAKQMRIAKQSLQNAERQVGTSYNKIQDTIIDRQFNGSHNGKHSYIRDHIMGKRMHNSATGVAMADPRLDIGEVGMDSKMMSALGAKEGDTVMMFRDPVWRDSAIRAMKVVYNEDAHGVAFNPMTSKSHDGDFDGDTYGVIKFNTEEANRDLEELFSHKANMLDVGDGNNNLNFHTGMDEATGLAVAKQKGDVGEDSPKAIMDRVKILSKSKDLNKLELAQQELSRYYDRVLGYAYFEDSIDLTSDETIEQSLIQMNQRGVKGSPKLNEETGKPIVVENFMKHHRGETTVQDSLDAQYATGVKTDCTGLAGSFSQKLVSVMRNHNIQAALEAMYPITQGTLQIKKDPKHASDVNDILSEDLPRLFRGKYLNDKGKEVPLTKPQFETKFTEIMEKDMGVEVNPKFVSNIAEVMSVNNQIVPLKEVMEKKGSPMDKVAYGGGFKELVDLAHEEASLLEGEYSQLFAPKSMRDPKDRDKVAIVKSDVLRKENNAKNLDLAKARESINEHEADIEIAKIEALQNKSEPEPKPAPQSKVKDEPVFEP